MREMCGCLFWFVHQLNPLPIYWTYVLGRRTCAHTISPSKRRPHMQHEHQFTRADHSIATTRSTPLRVAITGGTAGLGRALVNEFSKRNAEVAFIARNEERVAAVAGETLGTYGIVGDIAKKD